MNIGLQVPSMHAPYLFGESLKLLRVNILPDPFHIIPVRDNTMRYRVSNLEETAKLFCTMTDECIALHGPSHDSVMLGSSNTMRYREDEGNL